MKTLEQQITELTEKHNLQENVTNKLPNLKVSSFLFDYKKRGTRYNVNVDLTDKPPANISSDIQQILNAFPATKNNYLGFAGKDDKQTESPYLLRFKNGVRENYAEIEYISNEYNISIKVPVSFYSDDVKTAFYRKVTDSEYHYFTGRTIPSIQKIDLLAYKLELFDSVKYYGGDVVTYLADARDKEDTEEYESVLFKGHTPEFADFWQKQLGTNIK